MTSRQLDIATLLKQIDQIEARSWVPACGGTEVPFTKAGRTYLYMWNTFTKAHAYYCATSDLFLTNAEAQAVGL